MKKNLKLVLSRETLCLLSQPNFVVGGTIDSNNCTQSSCTCSDCGGGGCGTGGTACCDPGTNSKISFCFDCTIWGRLVQA